MLIAKNLYKSFSVKEGGLFSRKFKTIEAVRDVSIEIPEGKIVGLIGVNGAEKTTTIKMLSALLEPTAGSVFIDELDAVTHHIKAKERINLITGGERSLYWRLSARENLRYFGSLYNLPTKVLLPRIEELISLVSLTEFADVAVEKYSKGMKQRLQIARGLINDPKYIFLDEPTLGLDVVIANEFRTHIKMLAKERNKGVLLTTHYISEAEELCDYLYIIHDGAIIAQGKVEEIKRRFKTRHEYSLTYESATDTQLDILEGKFRTLSARIGKGEEANELIVSAEQDILPDILDTMRKQGIRVLSTRTLEANLEEIVLELLKNQQGA